MDKNIQEALKWIYASLGGDISALANVNDVTAILNAIADLDTVQKIKSATELPDVSDADDGDVLTVVDGEWAKAEPSGGGSSLPSVSSTDNGDVLTVVDGAWDKAASTGLPAVTSSDIGKSMMVQRGAASVGAVVVPQQTATYDGIAGAYPLSNVDTDLFTDGRCIQVTYGEDTEIGYIHASGPDDIYCDLVGGSLGYSSEAEGWYFWFYGDDPPASLTILANEVNYAADWSKVYPYDMGVTIDPFNETATLDFGTYDDVYSKLSEGRPVSISVATTASERYSSVGIFIEDVYIVAKYIWDDHGVAKFSSVQIASDGTVTAQ